MTVIESAPDSPPLSVTDAVIVWVPTLRLLMLNEPPLPIGKISRSEVQIIDAVRLPSSRSAAVPWKLMLVPSLNVRPLLGWSIVTVGAAACAQQEQHE